MRVAQLKLQELGAESSFQGVEAVEGGDELCSIAARKQDSDKFSLSWKLRLLSLSKMVDGSGDDIWEEVN